MVPRKSNLPYPVSPNVSPTSPKTWAYVSENTKSRGTRSEEEKVTFLTGSMKTNKGSRCRGSWLGRWTDCTRNFGWGSLWLAEGFPGVPLWKEVFIEPFRRCCDDKFDKHVLQCKKGVAADSLRKLGMTFFLKVSAHALPPLHLLPSFLYLKRGVRVKRKRQPFWLVQWKPTRVVGVGDPGLAGELIVPGTLAGAHSGWQRGLRGFLCEKRFSLSLFVTAVMISLTNMSCSAKREWRLTL